MVESVSNLIHVYMGACACRLGINMQLGSNKVFITRSACQMNEYDNKHYNILRK